MKIEALKEKLMSSVDLWADAQIDDMVKGNPMLAIPSVYIKRAAHNIIAKNKGKWSEQIDNAALFIADENGIVDAGTVFDDMMQMLKAIDDYQFDIGIIHGHIGGGMISIDLPDNIAMTLLFGSKRSINITTEDFAELRSLLTD
jgi:hypothetical protein